MIVHALYVSVRFKQETTNLRLALPAVDFRGQPLSFVLSLLNVEAAQALPGPYSIVGLLDSGGAPLDQNKSL